MGSSGSFVCTNRGYTAQSVTAEFDCGFSGELTTPIAYPECREDRAFWDCKACPVCGHEAMEQDAAPGLILWD